jgi:hypothetical protein
LREPRDDQREFHLRQCEADAVAGVPTERHPGHLGERSSVVVQADEPIGIEAQAISVRLDDEALRALAQLETTAFIRSAAIRYALVAAALRLRDRRMVAAEVALLEADEADRAEMRAVAELMEQLRA